MQTNLLPQSSLVEPERAFVPQMDKGAFYVSCLLSQQRGMKHHFNLDDAGRRW